MTKQEDYARSLRDELSKLFSTGPGSVVSIEGAGVHWNCAVSREPRRCLIHCFDVHGPEYLMSFEKQKHTCAMGRTPSNRDAISAVRGWLDGQEISQMHGQFAFIDQQKRFLNAILAKAQASCPELQRIGSEVLPIMCDLSELWFRAEDRSCHVSYWGKNIHPDAVFHWDGCSIFTIQVGEPHEFASILKLWLCDHVAPSVLRKHFPGIEMKKVAQYYEEGRGIEGEFVESWDRIEEFYRKLDFPAVASVRALIAEMRTRGFDRTLRAGQSMFTLILSRSRRHGLQEDQPRLAFQFREKGMNVVSNNATISFVRVEFREELETLLHQLEATAIN